MKIRILFLIFFLLISLSLIGSCEEEKPLSIELTIDNYQEEFLECEIPIVVYFWAVWCKPCKQMSPIIDRLAIFYRKKVKFLKVDVDHNKKLLNNFRPLRGLPLLIFFKEGKEIHRILGFTTFTAISGRLIPLLKKEKGKKKDKDDCEGGICPPPDEYLQK